MQSHCEVNSLQRSTGLTDEQEAQLQNLEAEIQIADKQLRLLEVKKQIVETELEVIGLRQTLQERLSEGTPVHQF
jgi:hypothetical protein